MTIASRTQFHIERPWGLNSILNVKAVVAAFNQEKALEGAFSVIVQHHRSFTALDQTLNPCWDEARSGWMLDSEI